MTYSIKGIEDDETEGSTGNRFRNTVHNRYAPEKKQYKQRKRCKR